MRWSTFVIEVQNTVIIISVSTTCNLSNNINTKHFSFFRNITEWDKKKKSLVLKYIMTCLQ